MLTYSEWGFRIMAASGFVGVLWNRLGLAGAWRKLRKLEIQYDGVSLEFNKATNDASYKGGMLDEKAAQNDRDAKAAQGFLNEIQGRRGSGRLPASSGGRGADDYDPRNPV